MEVRVDEVRPSPTAVVVVQPVDFARFIGCYDEVYSFLRADKTEVKQIGHNIALYEDDCMEVGVEVDRPFSATGQVVPSQLPGGRVAHATHASGYGDLRRTYEGIIAWCDETGYERAGPRWEVYSDPDESDHVDVEIYFLLA